MAVEHRAAMGRRTLMGGCATRTTGGEGELRGGGMGPGGDGGEGRGHEEAAASRHRLSLGDRPVARNRGAQT
jgi:hypothetical protein